MNNQVKKVLSPKPMISFRSARKMSSYLVRTYIQKKELKVPLSVAVSLVRFVYMLMKHLLLPAQLQVKLILLTTNLIVMTNAWFIF